MDLRRIILKWIFRKWDGGGMDWRQVTVNAVMDPRIPQNPGNLTS
jgi:hypothetical protein